MSAVAAELIPVPLDGLACAAPLTFGLYLATGPGRVVLYRDAETCFGDEHRARLAQEGVERLWIRRTDRPGYSRHVEQQLDAILRDKRVPLADRAAVLLGVASEIANDLLCAAPSQQTLGRAEDMLGATSSLVLRDPHGFRAVRQALTTNPGLAQHSLTVGMLALGLARCVVGSDPNTLVRAGLAGLLHDTGRIGAEDRLEEQDPDHCERGHDLLQASGLPREICEVALAHHERHDGTGHPQGLGGPAIPVLARIVALVNAFEKVFRGGQRGAPRLGVFDALRVLAGVDRGAFDERLARALVELFR